MLIITYLLEKDSGVWSRRGRSRKMHCGRISFNPARPARVGVCGLLSWRISREGGMSPTRQSGSFPFQEVPFEIYLKYLKESHQIPVNLLKTMESTIDFFFCFSTKLQQEEGNQSPHQNGIFVAELQSQNLYWWHGRNKPCELRLHVQTAKHHIFLSWSEDLWFVGRILNLKWGVFVCGKDL